VATYMLMLKTWRLGLW